MRLGAVRLGLNRGAMRRDSATVQPCRTQQALHPGLCPCRTPAGQRGSQGWPSSLQNSLANPEAQCCQSAIAAVRHRPGPDPPGPAAAAAAAATTAAAPDCQ